MEPVYRPAEDSYLLLRPVEKLVRGGGLDMGTGSGVQAVAAAQKGKVYTVTAVDLNPAALIEAEKRGRASGVLGKMRFIQGDLFTGVEGAYDWIVFNPPYLPSDGQPGEGSWAGGVVSGMGALEGVLTIMIANLPFAASFTVGLVMGLKMG